MFDVSFFEILVILIVALIVIGPERLPKVARTIGHLVGRFRSYLDQAKLEIDRELELDVLKKIHGDTETELHSIQDQYQKEMESVEQKFDTYADFDVALNPSEERSRSDARKSQT